MSMAGIRTWLNRNQKWLAIMVVIVLAGILWWVWHSIQTPAPVSAASSYYFYDTSTRQVSVRPATELPPLKNAAGKRTVVRAVFITCTSCGNRQLGYLLKYTAAARSAKKYLDNPPGKGAPQNEIGQFASEVPTLKLQVANGTLIRLPKTGAHWVYAQSPQGTAIIRKVTECPGHRYARTCVP